MTTSLMPLDSPPPEQVTRVLPIRAALLPAEIADGRRARRMRALVIVGVALVLLPLGTWSADAYRDYGAAQRDLASVDKQIADVTNTMNDSKHAKVTKTINDNKTISEQLKTLMAKDVRWSTLLTNLRATSSKSNVTLSRISAVSATEADTSGGTSTNGAAAGSTGRIATLTLEGTAKDKKTIAGFIQNLALEAKVSGVANPYLTSATQNGESTSSFTFTINADVTSVALCGRFTTACKSGGK